MNGEGSATESTAVAWDGSPVSQAALEWAFERERSRGGHLTLIRVIDTHRAPRDRAALDNEVDAAHQLASAEATRLRRLAPEMAVTIEVRVGDPLRELQHFANPRSVLAVGTTRRTGPHFRYGWSLGARLAASAAGPIAIIPSDHNTTGAGVVVGVDTSPVSHTAALFAAAEAQRRGEPLVVVNGWIEPPVWAETYVYENDFLQPFEDESERLTAAMVDEIRENYPGVSVESWAVHGAPLQVLRDASAHRGLLVVGTRSLRGITRLVLGSVSHSVVLDAQIPTIVVPHGASESLSDRHPPRML